VAPGAEARDLAAEAREYLSRHNTVSLATVGADGPWAATVFYVNLGFTLYLLSEPKTRHIQNILLNATIAATVNEDYRDWRQIKGIQMEATCDEITSKRELARAIAAYVKKYPFVAQFLSPGQLLRGMSVGGNALDVRLYRLRPTRMLYLDNERGFSNRQEVPLEETR
jgi:uncharacterized protein YhbP (UPF0306 family)